jgi:Flp pilus assembly protein TadB
MKFRSKTTEAVALTFAFVAVDIGCGVAFRLIDGHWPSLGFWLSGVAIYVAVLLPAAVQRSQRKVDDDSTIR